MYTLWRAHIFTPTYTHIYTPHMQTYIFTHTCIYSHRCELTHYTQASWEVWPSLPVVKIEPAIISLQVRPVIQVAKSGTSPTTSKEGKYA